MASLRALIYRKTAHVITAKVISCTNKQLVTKQHNSASHVIVVCLANSIHLADQSSTEAWHALFGPAVAAPPPLFWGDDVVFTEAFVEAVSVFAVKESNPACLLTEVFQNRVILLC